MDAFAKAKAWYMARIPSHMGSLAFSEEDGQVVPFLWEGTSVDRHNASERVVFALCILERYAIGVGQQAIAISRAWEKARIAYNVPREVGFRGALALGLVRTHRQPMSRLGGGGDAEVAACLAGQLLTATLKPGLLFDVEEKVISFGDAEDATTLVVYRHEVHGSRVSRALHQQALSAATMAANFKEAKAAALAIIEAAQ